MAVKAILQDYTMGRDIDWQEFCCYPDRETVADMLTKLRWLIFPGYFRKRNLHTHEVVEDVLLCLSSQIGLVLQGTENAQVLALEFLHLLPEIRRTVQTDVQAAYDGDPAACGKEEVIFSYPGLFAVTVYRLAHALMKLGVPMIPRMMTEYAHSLTGIDIHPGAQIGDYFFIDHGTGVVIGETAVIGKGVRLYQGVTLGGLSTRGGQTLRGIKRHPTIEDNVTVYANATVLGGETVIGAGSTIGANVFILQSVEPNTTVTAASQPLQFRVRA